MSQRPWWVVAFLLGLLALLMVSHLSLLWYGAWLCGSHAQIVIHHVEESLAKREDPVLHITDDENPECSAVEKDFSETAAQYIAVILALLGGAGASAAVARRNGGPDAKS